MNIDQDMIKCLITQTSNPTNNRLEEAQIVFLEIMSTWVLLSKTMIWCKSLAKDAMEQSVTYGSKMAKNKSVIFTRSPNTAALRKVKCFDFFPFLTRNRPRKVSLFGYRYDEAIVEYSQVHHTVKKKTIDACRKHFILY